MARLAWRSDPDQVVASARLNPRFAYLRVQGPTGPAALLALGYLDESPDGPVQTWYSASQETLQTVRGRIRLTHGLLVDRLHTQWPQALTETPATVLSETTPARFTQVIDQGGPGPRGLRLSVTLTDVPVTDLPARVLAQVRGAAGERAHWRWLREELAIAQPGHPQDGQRFMTNWLALSGRDWVFSHQCIQPDYCLSLQPWPVGTAPPHPAGRS